MDNVKEFISDNRVFIVVSIIVIALAVLFIVFSNSGETETDDYSLANSSYVDPLPSVTEKETSPVMYDYIQGTLGYNSDVSFDNISNYYYAIAVDKNILDEDNGAIYISLYSTNNLTPAVGSNYRGINLDGDQWKLVSGYLKTWPSELSCEEGNYKFCALTNTDSHAKLSQYKDYGTVENVGSIEWCGIQLKNIKFEDSKFKENYVKTKGYPTDWIRKYNDKYNNGNQFIDEPLNIDFANDFWDRWNYQQIVELKEPDNEDIDRYLVGGTDEFYVIEEIDEDGHVHKNDAMINENIVNMLIDSGYIMLDD